MRLFWKIFVAVFFSFVATVSYISYIILVRQISDAQKSLINENKTIVNFISKEIEVSYLEFNWPFESLRKLSEREDFLFWWISREDGIIHLANNASFMGTNAYTYFPRKVNTENLILKPEQNYRLLIQPLKTGERNWIFWLGFSTRGISKIRNSIILLHLIVSLSALLILGVILYFLIKHFTRPIKELAIGAKIKGKAI